MRVIEVKADWLPEGEVAEIDETREGYRVTLPREGITPRTAHALTAALGHIMGKWRQWDVRNPKVLTAVALLAAGTFTGGLIVAPAEVRHIVQNVLPDVGRGAEAATVPEPVAPPAQADAGAYVHDVPSTVTRKPEARKTQTIRTAPKPAPTRAKPAAPTTDPKPTPDAEPTQPAPTNPPSTTQPAPNTPGDTPKSENNGNGNGNGRDDLAETNAAPFSLLLPLFDVTASEVYDHGRHASRSSAGSGARRWVRPGFHGSRGDDLS